MAGQENVSAGKPRGQWTGIFNVKKYLRHFGLFSIWVRLGSNKKHLQKCPDLRDFHCNWPKTREFFWVDP